MKEMLAFMIARDTMYQQQWLAVIEELGGTAPDSKGEFTPMISEPLGDVLHLAPARPHGGAHRGQRSDDPATASQMSAGQVKTGLPSGNDQAAPRHEGTTLFPLSPAVVLTAGGLLPIVAWSCLVPDQEISC